jgi:ubiquinone/menaquinone biosynthesis C-methylase UbiE
MSGDSRSWIGWKARLYALLHRNPASNLAVVDWAELEPGNRVLDIGCGPGVAVNAAAPGLVDGQVVGVDPSADFVRIARRRTRGLDNVLFQVASAESLPFQDATFDVAWSVHSTHHWHHLDAGVGEALRVLRPGGRFLVVERHDPGKPWGIDTDQAQALADVLGATGFVDVNVERRAVGRSEEFLVTGKRP